MRLVEGGDARECDGGAVEVAVYRVAAAPKLFLQRDDLCLQVPGVHHQHERPPRPRAEGIEAVKHLVQALLAAAPGLHCLATTQEPLKVPGEQVLRVAALAVPPEGTALHDALAWPALALLHEVRTPQMTQLLLTAAMRAALARGCNLIFAPGETEADRALNRELGFVDVGSMVCYAAPSENVNEVVVHDIMVQPVLALRR